MAKTVKTREQNSTQHSTCSECLVEPFVPLRAKWKVCCADPYLGPSPALHQSNAKSITTFTLGHTINLESCPALLGDGWRSHAGCGCYDMNKPRQASKLERLVETGKDVENEALGCEERRLTTGSFPVNSKKRDERTTAKLTRTNACWRSRPATFLILSMHLQHNVC